LTDRVGRAFRKGLGCQQCHDSGFHGRFGIYEVMEVNPQLRRMIHHAAPSHELRDEFKKQGGRTLREEGVLMSVEGRSSLDEILRVTHSDEENDLAMKPAAQTTSAAAGGNDPPHPPGATTHATRPEAA
jgi:hypothetical protein